MDYIAKISEVPNFGKKIVSVFDKEILLVNVKGVIYAFANECPHQGSPMNSAVVKDGYIACPRHGYRFSLIDGNCAEHPNCSLETFPVKVVGDDIMINLG